MIKLWSELMKMDVAELLDHILTIQTETYGQFEIQQLTNFIKQHQVKRVLDIGTGQGAFLLKLSSALQDVQFCGVEHNQDFIRKAKTQKEILRAKNVEFIEATFNAEYPLEKHDLILSRYCLQHSLNPKDFNTEVSKRLQDHGAYITTDEYLFESNIDDAVWREFYESWMKCFELAGANPVIPRNITTWLSQVGFKSIENRIQIYSPATIGGDEFKSLIMCLSTVLCKIYPHVMKESLLGKLDHWFDEISVSKKVDPHVQVAYATGFKNEDLI